MKKKKLILRAIILFFLTIPVFLAIAQTNNLPSSNVPSAQFTSGSAANLIYKIIELIGKIGSLIALVILAYGVFKIATSGGDPKQFSEGKLLIIWGGLGIILCLILINAQNALSNWLGISIQ